MKSRLLSALSVGALCVSAASAQAGTAEGKIASVHTYGDGRVLVLGLFFDGATCTNNGGFWIPGTHKYIQRMLGLILSAQASGATLSVVAKTENCWYPEITEDPNSYVIVQSP